MRVEIKYGQENTILNAALPIVRELVDQLLLTVMKMQHVQLKHKVVATMLINREQ